MAVLAIDAGTSACKAAVFDEKGVVAMAGSAYPAQAANPGRAELDAACVWEMVQEAAAKAVAEARGRTGRITAVSFSSMGEAAAPVTLDRRVAGPILLATDTRGAEYSERLEREFGQDGFYKINPNFIGPYYTVSKLMWQREHAPEVYRKADKYLMVADFLAFMFGGEPRACNTLANRTLLYDMNADDWSDRLLAWSGVDREKLGRISRAGDVIGSVSRAVRERIGLEGEVAIVTGGHDQCTNALGCGAVKAGKAVDGIGTYETFCPAFARPEDPMRMLAERLNCERHVVPGLYVSFLYNHSCLLVDWFIRAFASADRPAPGETIHTILERELPAGPTNILVLPHHEPPQWPEYIGDSSGVFVGLKTSTTRGEMYKALLEGITYYFHNAIDAMRRIGVGTDQFIASGGGSRSDAWLQIKADILGVPFTRLRSGQGSLTGAGIIAGMAAGMFASFEEGVSAYVELGETFEPDPGRNGIYAGKAALYGRMARDLNPLLHDLSLS